MLDIDHCYDVYTKFLTGSDDPELTPEQASAQVVDYIENYYNSESRHSTLDFFSPIAYELRHMVLQQNT
ncbi:MAG: IS3 family transposase [Acidobacteriota bacterium]